MQLCKLWFGNNASGANDHVLKRRAPRGTPDVSLFIFRFPVQDRAVGGRRLEQPANDKRSVRSPNFPDGVLSSLRMTNTPRAAQISPTEKRLEAEMVFRENL